MPGRVLRPVRVRTAEFGVGQGNAEPGPGQPTTTLVPESNAPQAKPADPKYRAKIHTELAAAYYQAGSMAVALEEVRIALEADPDYVQAYSVRGLIRTQLKENVKADEDFQRALKIAPKNPDVNNNYGWFLCETGQPRQAIQYFLNAVKDPLYETPEVAYANAGKCALKAGDMDGAQEYLLQALRLSKNSAPETRYQLANVFYLRGNLDESKIYLNEAVKAMEPPRPRRSGLASGSSASWATRRAKAATHRSCAAAIRRRRNTSRSSGGILNDRVRASGSAVRTDSGGR